MTEEVDPQKYKLLKKRLKQVIQENEKITSMLADSKTSTSSLEQRLKVLEKEMKLLKQENTVLVDRLADTQKYQEIDELEEQEESVQSVEEKKKRIKKYLEIPVVNGQLQLPVTLGVITLENLGQVVFDRSSFHSERYIYPVGFRTSRDFLSYMDPTKTVRYTCEIVDGGDAPRFKVTAQDDLEHPSISTTATGAWSPIFKQAHQIRNKEHNYSASGPDYFGFTQPTVLRYVQDLPNADKCSNYKRQEVI
ncbi:F/Y rich C-terminus-domain-containing protein [Gorgonomyces haynaldii]|nr:F/Y rich C-terminus-domain-containing protein [Gorgonomyces haynaldii]